MSYLMGLDIGTSGVKGLLISTGGEITASKTVSYPLLTPRAGWAEQEPSDWWSAARTVIKGIINKGNINPADIKGISLSGQMHSSVFLDRNMDVIRPAILWSDTRNSSECQEIGDRVGGLNKLIELVSNPALEGFTAPKILWLRKNEPELYRKLRLVLLPKDYIRYRLTGEIFTEVSDGAGTLLMDVVEGNWSDKILNLLVIDRSVLPPILNSVDIAGYITKSVAEDTGLTVGTPVAAGGADNACGAVGSGIIQEGRVMVSIGSSGVVLAQSEKPSADRRGRIHLFNHAVPGSWYMMGVMLSAGLSFKWLKEDLFSDSYDYSELDKLAAAVDKGSEGLIYLPYLYGERTPHADASARGVFFGISGRHKQGHFARSVMEGVSFGLKDSLELIKEKGVKVNEIRITGGGARSKVWQQILADIFEQPVRTMNIEEGPAFGAALVAGVGVGVYSSFAEAEEEIIKVKNTIGPDEKTAGIYNELYQVYRELYPDLKDHYKSISEIYNS